MQLSRVACESTSRRKVAMLCAFAMSTRRWAAMVGSPCDSAAKDRKRYMRAKSGNSDDDDADDTEVIRREA
jgi:predicted nucleic acid-binding Zn ribbon protein